MDDLFILLTFVGGMMGVLLIGCLVYKLITGEDC